jgi:hypothetical protein
MALGAACSGAPIEPLVGEPEQAGAYTAPPAAASPAEHGLRRFVAAMEAGRHEGAWLHLSLETREALRARAAAIGVRGVDLLGPRPAGLSETARAGWIESPLELFVGPGPRTLQAGPPPRPLYQPADGRTLEQVVTARAASGQVRQVLMRFEGLHWRVHNPALQPSDVAPGESAAPAKAPAPAEAEPPAADEKEGGADAKGDDDEAP